MTIQAFVKRNPVLCYFAITFAVSWGAVLVLGAPYGMPTPAETFDRVWPSVLMPYLLGPSIASLLLTGLLHGRAGFREIKSRLLKWRVGARWYAVAILTVPLLVATMLFTLSRFSSEFLPAVVTSDDWAGTVLTGITVGFVFGGLAEEMGWTGFAVPRLRRRHGFLATGLILGFIWGVWHILPTYWGSGDPSGALSLELLLPPCLFYMGVLPAYRVLMVWVHDRSGSLLVTMLMHASLTGNTLFILAPAARGVPLLGYYVVLTIAMWVVVAAVALNERGQLARLPLVSSKIAVEGGAS